MSIPKGIVCTAEEFNRSQTDPSIYCLTRGQSIGLTVCLAVASYFNCP